MRRGELRGQPAFAFVDHRPGAQVVVFAQLPVVGGLQFLDQSRFLEQGTDLAGGFDPVDAPDLLGQRHFLCRTVVGGEVRQHALADVLGLADVERQVAVVAFFTVEKVNAGRVGQVVDQRSVEMRRQAGAGVQFVQCGVDLIPAAVDVDFLPKLVDQLRVGQRPVAGVGLQAGAGLAEAGHAIVIGRTSAIDRGRRDAAWWEVARRLAPEVKNPLTPIQLAAERLRRRVLPRLLPDDAEVLDRATHTIVAQVDALKTLVNAFGEYARAPQLELHPIDINRLVDEVLDLYDSDPRLQLVRDLQTELPNPRADQGRLRQVLHNLLKNAQEASAERPVLQLRVSTCLRDDAGRQWLDLSVEDDGPGLPTGFDASWFEPYRTTKAKGRGLGLAIVRKIAEEHGGQLLAENRTEGGARFILRWPVGLG